MTELEIERLVNDRQQILFDKEDVKDVLREAFGMQREHASGDREQGEVKYCSRGASISYPVDTIRRVRVGGALCRQCPWFGECGKVKVKN